MSALKEKTIAIARCAAALLLVGYMAYAVVWAHALTADRRCAGLHIEVVDAQGSQFVTAREVAHELGAMAKSPSLRRLRDIDIDSMERRLNAVDKIERATVTKLTDGTVNVEVAPMRPVARVFDSSGSYYINKDGKRISATARYHSDAPIIYGAFDSALRAVDMLPLLRYVSGDTTWASLITCVKVDGPRDVLLVPVFKGHVVNLGDIADLDDKFSRLRRAYREILPVKGWDYYDTISVKWRGQIVATRRAKSPRMALDAQDLEAEREAPDVGTMLVGDTVTISNNQSVPAASAPAAPLAPADTAGAAAAAPAPATRQKTPQKPS